MYAQLALMSGLRDIADVVELVGSSVLVWGGHRTFYFRAGITSYFGYTIKVMVIHPSLPLWQIRLRPLPSFVHRRSSHKVLRPQVLSSHA